METKMIKVHDDVHKLLKEQADRVAMTMIDYMRFLAYSNRKKKGK